MEVTTKLVNVVLLFHIGYLSTLLLPIPSSFKNGMINFFQASYIKKATKHVFIGIYLLLTILFADSIMKLKQDESTVFQYQTERNLYLSSFALYLGIVTYQFVGLLKRLFVEQKQAEYLRKQALNQKDFVAGILEKSKNLDEALKDKDELKKKFIEYEVQIKNMNTSYMDLLGKYNQLRGIHNSENKKTK